MPCSVETPSLNRKHLACVNKSQRRWMEIFGTTTEQILLIFTYGVTTWKAANFTEVKTSHLKNYYFKY